VIGVGCMERYEMCWELFILNYVEERATCSYSLS
jgi:hypothetical protein